jgi:hypothetical protein
MWLVAGEAEEHVARWAQTKRRLAEQVLNYSRIPGKPELRVMEHA